MFFFYKFYSYEIELNNISKNSIRNILNYDEYFYEKETEQIKEKLINNEIKRVELKIFDKIYILYICRICKNICLNPFDPINYYEDVENIEFILYGLDNDKYYFNFDYNETKKSNYLKLKEEYKNKFDKEEYYEKDKDFFKGSFYSQTSIFEEPFPLCKNPIINLYFNKRTTFLIYCILLEKQNKAFINLKNSNILEWKVFDIIEEYI